MTALEKGGCRLARFTRRRSTRSGLLSGFMAALAVLAAGCSGGTGSTDSSKADSSQISPSTVNAIRTDWSTWVGSTKTWQNAYDLISLDLQKQAQRITTDEAQEVPQEPSSPYAQCGNVPSYTDASAFTQYENCVDNGYSTEINSDASAANQMAAARNDLTEAMSQIDADYSQYTQAASTLGAALTQFIEGIRMLSLPSSDGQAVTAVVNASTALRNVIDNMISFTPSTPASQIASNNASLIAANQNLSDAMVSLQAATGR